MFTAIHHKNIHPKTTAAKRKSNESYFITMTHVYDIIQKIRKTKPKWKKNEENHKNELTHVKNTGITKEKKNELYTKHNGYYIVIIITAIIFN